MSENESESSDDTSDAYPTFLDRMSEEKDRTITLSVKIGIAYGPSSLLFVDGQFGRIEYLLCGLALKHACGRMDDIVSGSVGERCGPRAVGSHRLMKIYLLLTEE